MTTSKEKSELATAVGDYCENTFFGPPPGQTVDEMDEELLVKNMRSMAYLAGAAQVLEWAEEWCDENYKTDLVCDKHNCDERKGAILAADALLDELLKRCGK